MRTIHLTNSSQEKFDDFFAANHAQTEAAIGYLSLWNLRDFPEVSIYWNGRHGNSRRTTARRPAHASTLLAACGTLIPRPSHSTPRS